MPTRLRLSCRALLITVLVRSNSIQPWAPCLPPAKSGPDSALTRLTDNSKRNRRLKIYITCKDKQMTSRTFSGDYSQEFVIYTVSQKSEPPKQFATATANLHRFKWNFTHTRLHLVLSSTSNFIRIPYSVYEMFNSFKLLSHIHISVKSRRIYMKLCSNVCNRCHFVCVKFYLNRSRFAVVVAKC